MYILIFHSRVFVGWQYAPLNMNNSQNSAYIIALYSRQIILYLSTKEKKHKDKHPIESVINVIN